jgi:hypothetical protein
LLLPLLSLKFEEVLDRYHSHLVQEVFVRLKVLGKLSYAGIPDVDLPLLGGEARQIATLAEVPVQTKRQLQRLLGVISCPPIKDTVPP